jgi:hypothetical protein
MVARFSHCDSVPSLSSSAPTISGRCSGTFSELEGLRLRCRRCDKRLVAEPLLLLDTEGLRLWLPLRKTSRLRRCLESDLESAARY